MKTNLHHVSLFTNDLERSLVLFKDLLGFKEIWSVGPVGGKGMAAVFGLEDMKALPPCRRPPPYPWRWKILTVCTKVLHRRDGCHLRR